MRLQEIKKHAKLVHSLDKVPAKNLSQLIKHLDPKIITFLTKCLASIVTGNSSHFRLKPKHRDMANKAWQPYKSSLEKMSRPKNTPAVVKRIQKQKGEGFIFSAILSAAIPLITHLISKIFSPAKQAVKK